MRLSAILLLVLIGIIVWSTMRMTRRREEARRGRDAGSGGETPTTGGSTRDKRGDPDRGDANDGDGGGGGD